MINVQGRPTRKKEGRKKEGMHKLIGFNEVLVPNSSVCVELMILFYHCSSHSGNEDSLPILLSLLII